MKIFDCFMYFNEEIVLDLRLNTLDKYVDYFIIVESKFTHRGDKRNLIFDIEKYKKFKNKIIYLIYDEIPNKIEKIKDDDNKKEKTRKYIMNAIYRENGQRNYIMNGIEKADENDLILISDVDEIPNLSNIQFEKINEKIIMFQQDMFYYKFDLKIPNIIWTGTRACKKKYLKNPQWLRNIKERNYSPLRLDILFSKKKYSNIKIIQRGGWHFTNINTAEEIKHKLKSYLHHIEFDSNPLSTEQIKEVIKSKRAIYDLRVDQRLNKIGNGTKLVKIEIEKLPIYIQQNKHNYLKWLD